MDKNISHREAMRIIKGSGCKELLESLEIAKSYGLKPEDLGVETARFLADQIRDARIHQPDTNWGRSGRR